MKGIALFLKAVAISFVENLRVYFTRMLPLAFLVTAVVTTVLSALLFWLTPVSFGTFLASALVSSYMYLSFFMLALFVTDVTVGSYRAYKVLVRSDEWSYIRTLDGTWLYERRAA